VGLVVEVLTDENYSEVKVGREIQNVLAGVCLFPSLFEVRIRAVLSILLLLVVLFLANKFSQVRLAIVIICHFLNSIYKVLGLFFVLSILLLV
jgi:hypothetical protein